MAIENARIADNGHLILVLPDGTEVDAGNTRGIPGPQGERGTPGAKGDPGNPGPQGPTATPVAMVYAQNATASVMLSGVGTVISIPITTTGKPVLICANGDANPQAQGWCSLQLFRDNTAIGKPIQAEGQANENNPYSISVIDAPAAGTYTYSLRMTTTSGAFQFGERDGPVIYAIELSGGVGPKGDTGAPGVGIKGFASGYVDAGQFITLDNIKATVTTGGNRGLSVASVSGTFQAMISSTFGYINGVGGNATNGSTPPVYNLTPSVSWFGYHFPNAGDGSTYLVNDITNQRFYRIHLMIGPGYLRNFISIERLY